VTIAIAGVVVMGQRRMWQTSLGELIWFVLVGFVVYALMAVYRHWRTY